MPNDRSGPAARRYATVLIGLFLICAGPLSIAADKASPTYDLIIEHGRVVDGTGAPWFAADVGIRAGRIAAIGQLDKATAKRRIDAAGALLRRGSLTCSVSPNSPCS